jgi:hypothetical protein
LLAQEHLASSADRSQMLNSPAAQGSTLQHAAQKGLLL